jgi:biotin carboxyl carrier protein
MSGTKEHICVACGVVREQVSAEPVSRGYELRTLICPKCRTVLRFVDKRPKNGPAQVRTRAEGKKMSEATVTEIKVPKIAGALNLSVGRWFKRVGDPVNIGEPIVEIETFNLTHDIQAPATGILSKVLVEDGGTVEPGAVIGIIDRL